MIPEKPRIQVTLTALLLAALAAGCDGNPDRRAAFSRPQVVVDRTGGLWVVEHHLGDNYRLNRPPAGLVLEKEPGQ